jgi:hypothetical protein
LLAKDDFAYLIDFGIARSRRHYADLDRPHGGHVVLYGS